MRPIANAEQLSARSLKPMPQNNAKPKLKMIGYELIANMSDKDRAQEIWDRAMGPEAKDWMEKYMSYKAGLDPYPGKYNGLVIDFENVAKGLQEEYLETHDE
jgi:hypothetical protein